MLAAGFSLVMLGFGGASGLINMSYSMNSTVHNTQWVTGHFHLIFGGCDRDHVFRDRLRAVAARHRPAACRAPSRSPATVDLVRRHARHCAALASGRCHGTTATHGVLRLHRSRARAAGDRVSVSAVGGFVLVFSAVLLIGVLIASHRTRGVRRCAPHVYAGGASAPEPACLAQQLRRVDLAGGRSHARELRYPIAQSVLLKNTGVAAYPVQAR